MGKKIKLVKCLIIAFLAVFTISLYAASQNVVKADFTGLDGLSPEPSSTNIKITLENEGGQELNTVFYIDRGAALPSLQQLATALGKDVIPHKAGYEFTGFYTKQDGQGIQWWDSNGNPLKETYNYSFPASYWAGWRQCVTITVNPNNGNSSYNIYRKRFAGEFFSDNLLKNPINKLSKPTNSGKPFEGYRFSDDTMFTDENGNFTSYASQCGSATVKAKWYVKPETSYIKLSATTTGGIKNVYYSKKSLENLTSASDLLPSPASIPSGDSSWMMIYIYVTIVEGYQTSSSTSFKIIDGVLYDYVKVDMGNHTSDKTFGPFYREPYRSTISFNANGGTYNSNLNSIQCDYGSELQTISYLPTRTNYKFLGYFDQQTDGNQYYFANLTPVKRWDKEDETVTLYAHWARINYTATLVTGTGDDIDITVAYDDGLPDLTSEQLPTPRIGYTFTGYYDQEIGGNKYYNADGTCALAYDIEGDSIFYAHFEIEECIKNTMNAIESIGTVAYTTSSKEKIESAETLYSSLDADHQAVISNYSTLVQKREQYDSLMLSAVTNAINLIEAIGEVEYPTSGSKITAAENAFNGLLASEQNAEIITNYQKLLDAKVEYANQKSTIVDRIIAAIDAIGTVSYPESLSLINNANHLYNLSNDNEKSGVTNYSTLVAANETFNPLRAAAILDVKNKIDDIVEIKPLVYPDVNQKITAARTAFDSLAEADQNAEVVSNYQTLLDAEEVTNLVNYMNSIGEVVNTEAYNELLNTAYTRYEALTSDQKALFPVSVRDGLITKMQILYVIKSIDSIGKVAYTDESRLLINTARQAYEDLDDSLKGRVTNLEKLTKAIDDYDKVHDVILTINNLPEFEYTQEFKNLLDNSKDKFDSLTLEQKEIVTEDVILKLNDLLDKYDAYNQLINIGELENTNECFDRIEEVIISFDKLTDTQKSILPADKVSLLLDYKADLDVIELINSIEQDNFESDITDDFNVAKNSYNSLTARQKELMPQGVLDLLNNKEKAYNMMVLIQTVKVLDYNEEYLTKLTAARNLYDTLTDQQKEMVINYDTLVKNEDSYNRIDSVVKSIENLNNIEYNKESKDAIDNAKNGFDNLSEDEQKVLLNNNKYEKLDEAYILYEQAEKSYRIRVTLVSIFSIVALGAGAFASYFFVFKKRRTKKEENVE